MCAYGHRLHKGLPTQPGCASRPRKEKKGEKKENGKQQRLPVSFVLLFFFFLAACVLLTLGFLYSVLTVSFTESVRHRHGVMKRVLH